MFDYGSARHARHTKNKRHKTAVQSTADRSHLRFFLLALVLSCGLGFLIFTKLIPGMVHLDDPENILIVNSQSEQEGSFIVHLNPDESLSFAVENPSNQDITVPFSDDTTTIGKLHFSLINQGKGEAFINTVFSHLLGILIQKQYVVSLAQEPTDTTELFKASVLNEKMPFRARLESLKYYFYSKKRSIPIRKLERVESLSQQLSDNQAVWKNKKTRDCPIAVINTTATQGLAQSYSAILERSGGFVIRVTSGATLKDKSVLFQTESTACKELEKSIKSLFPEEIETIVDSTVTDEYRSGIVLVLGSDAF